MMIFKVLIRFLLIPVTGFLALLGSILILPLMLPLLLLLGVTYSKSQSLGQSHKTSRLLMQIQILLVYAWMMGEIFQMNLREFWMMLTPCFPEGFISSMTDSTGRSLL